MGEDGGGGGPDESCCTCNLFVRDVFFVVGDTVGSGGDAGGDERFIFGL